MRSPFRTAFGRDGKAPEVSKRTHRACRHPRDGAHPVLGLKDQGRIQSAEQSQRGAPARFAGPFSSPHRHSMLPQLWASRYLGEQGSRQPRCSLHPIPSYSAHLLHSPAPSRHSGCSAPPVLAPDSPSEASVLPLVCSQCTSDWILKPEALAMCK